MFQLFGREHAPMSILNSILGQIGQHVDVANMAEKLGIDPAMAEKAIAALGQAHQMEGDTIEVASAKTGLDTGILGQILGMLDRDGDGNPLNDISGIAKGLFGKG
jgi:hypothetical protein